MSVKKELWIEHLWDGTLLEPCEDVIVWLELTDDGLKIEFVDWLHDNDGPPTEPDPEKGTWELWNYDVVELFLVGENGEYTEIEMGPYGHHLILQLDGPRSIVRKEIPMQYEALDGDYRWAGKGFVDKQWLPENIVRANAFAIHTLNGERRYCCYTPLPGPKPDFHQPDRFALWDDIPNTKAASRSTD